MYKILLPPGIEEFAVVMVIFFGTESCFIGLFSEIRCLLHQVSQVLLRRNKHFQQNKLGAL